MFLSDSFNKATVVVRQSAPNSKIVATEKQSASVPRLVVYSYVATSAWIATSHTGPIVERIYVVMMITYVNMMSLDAEKSCDLMSILNNNFYK